MKTASLLAGGPGAADPLIPGERVFAWPTDDDLAEVISAHRGPWLRLAILASGSRANGEDLLQESLISLAKAWPRLTRRGVNAYMRRIIINGAIDRSRRHLDIPTSDLPDGPGTSDLLRRESDQSFFDLVARLPTDQRAALICRYYLGLNDSDTAQLLGCARPTVRSHVKRAIATLRSSRTAEALKECRP